MKISHIATLVAGVTLALTLSACGGGGGSDGIPPSISEAAPPPKHITIYLDGDSTNVGYDPDYPSGFAPTTPAMRMQADFDVALPGRVTVIAGAQLGNTFTWDTSGGGPNQIIPVTTRIAQLSIKPDIVISNFELNDQYLMKDTDLQYATAAYQWIQNIQAIESLPVIQEPNPICEAGNDIPVSDQFVFTMESVAAGAQIHALPVYAAFKAQENWCATLLSVDGAHPNDAGYAFKEGIFFSELLPIVQAMLAD